MSPFLVIYGYKLASLILIAGDVYTEEYCLSTFKMLVKNYVKCIKDIIKLYKAVITIATLN